jgi:lysophospholipase L1-like esterase
MRRRRRRLTPGKEGNHGSGDQPRTEGHRIILKRTLIVTSLAFAFSASAAPVGAEPALPDSIAAIGDSITRATNACCFYGDHPSQSWSTGLNPLGPVNSHLERLISRNPTILGDEYNDARAGARMASADDQAGLAVSQDADYVTILMGANDACTSSRSTMTSVSDFRTQFESAMTVLTNGLPDSHVFVASIPNVRRLWSLFHDDAVARFVWRTAGICQSMLSPSNTAADRRAVYNRIAAFNSVLAEVCAAYPNCRYDGGALFAYRFTRDQVSRLDYFHPDLDGQAALASVTWQRSWWP